MPLDFSAMNSFDGFPDPCFLNQRSIREINGVIEEGSSEVVVFNEDLYYPSIFIDPARIIKPTLLKERASDVFLENQTSVLKKALRSWRSRGFIAAVTIMAFSDCGESIGLQILQKLAQVILFFWTHTLVVYSYLYPYAMLSADQLCSEFARCMDYGGHIRSFTWHPTLIKCAIGLSNDNVYVYSSKIATPALLRHPLQKKITDLAWKASNQEVLAVGCQSVVLIWTVDPNDSQPSTAGALVIRLNAQIPITSITFDPSGEYLCSVSPSSSSIVLTNLVPTSMEQKVVRRLGSGVTFQRWSPDKVRLMTGTTSNFIRIFENQSWSSKKWAKELGDVCQTACWSKPDGKILLFALKAKTTIYAVALYDKAQAGDVGGANSCIPFLDVAEKTLPSGVTVGGLVHDMLWDKHSERLVISFKDNPKYIAVYKTKTKPNLEVTPVGFIHGIDDEIPLVMAFHDPFKAGSLLTVCWSSGYVSHIPLQYAPNEKVTHSTSILSSPRCLTSFCVNSPVRDVTSFYSPTKSFLDASQVSVTSRDFVVSPRKPTLFSQLNLSEENQ